MKLIDIDQNNIPIDFNIQEHPTNVLAISKDNNGHVKFWKEIV